MDAARAPRVTTQATAPAVGPVDEATTVAPAPAPQARGHTASAHRCRGTTRAPAARATSSQWVWVASRPATPAAVANRTGGDRRSQASATSTATMHTTAVAPP